MFSHLSDISDRLVFEEALFPIDIQLYEYEFKEKHSSGKIFVQYLPQLGLKSKKKKGIFKDPFAPPEEKLTIYEKDGYYIAFNKFNIINCHLLLINSTPIFQRCIPNGSDFHQFSKVFLEDKTAIFGFNSGYNSGYSQPHRHFHLVFPQYLHKFDSSAFHGLSDIFLGDKDKKMESFYKFSGLETVRHGVVKIDGYDPISIQNGYNILMHALLHTCPWMEEKEALISSGRALPFCCEPSPKSLVIKESYNLVVTKDLIACFVRSREYFVADVSVNWFGMLGYLLCKNKDSLKLCDGTTYSELMQSVCINED
ncbi:ATP adenylyltransferase like protein [Aduncisulcus paluster]|uniref:ATP adenylyltransferase like protein n=1 Tax=Aduncisulcus paluster TaxID=2918883 RepID=A0ABQ5JVY8_9EUKA|nr:ATP adenylyltransferase like protein [Aduncisulcus paluster]